MFRIDRRFVKLTNARLQTPESADDESSDSDDSETVENSIDELQSADINSDKIITDDNNSDNDSFTGTTGIKAVTAGAEETAKRYISATQRELKEKEQALEEYKQELKKLEQELKKQEEETIERAGEIIADAREQAARIIEKSREEIQEEKKRGFEEGFKEGFEKGESEGKEKYDTELAAYKESWDNELKDILEEIERERERINNELEGNSTDIAIEIVRKIFNPAEEELGTVFLSQIKNAFRQIPTDGKFVIRVAPSQYEKFFSTGAMEMELDSGTVVTANVFRDTALEDGDLIIDTEDITVNAGLQSQLKYVQLAFERANQYEPEQLIN